MKVINGFAFSAERGVGDGSAEGVGNGAGFRARRPDCPTVVSTQSNTSAAHKHAVNMRDDLGIRCIVGFRERLLLDILAPAQEIRELVC